MGYDFLAQWSDKQCIEFLGAMKKKKIAYCMEHDLPIPPFDKEEDYFIPDTCEVIPSAGCDFCDSPLREPKQKDITLYWHTEIGASKPIFILDIERPGDCGYIPEKYRNKRLQIYFCPICGRKLEA